MSSELQLSDRAFAAVTQVFQQASGIQLGPAKRALICGRLQRLAQARGISSLDDYVDLLVRGGDPDEIVRAVDKLTTNETYFFREPQHFDALAEAAGRFREASRPMRVWSAASSSGEEAYSIAMVLAGQMGSIDWEVVGTDLSTAMVDSARQGLYPMERGKHIPAPLLKRWCLRGHDEYEGQFLVTRELRERARFLVANLTRPLPDIGQFDIVFLRNVLIYFEAPAKRDIVLRVIARLNPDGLLFTGHAESVANLDLPLRSLAPAVYCHA